MNKSKLDYNNGYSSSDNDHSQPPRPAERVEEPPPFQIPQRRRASQLPKPPVHQHQQLLYKNENQYSDSEISQKNERNRHLEATRPSFPNLDHIPRQRIKQLNKRIISSKQQELTGDGDGDEFDQFNSQRKSSIDQKARSQSQSQSHTYSTPQLWPDETAIDQSKLNKPAPVNFSSTQAINKEFDSQDLYLNNNSTLTTSAAVATNHRASQPASPPLGTFGTSFQPLATSTAAQVINKSMPLTSVSGVKPEKLFSAKHLNQKAMYSSNKNLHQVNANGTTAAVANDSDGSENSHMSLASVGANFVYNSNANNNNNTNANTVSSLASDPNRITTVSTNANSTTTTTIMKGKV